MAVRWNSWKLLLLYTLNTVVAILPIALPSYVYYILTHDTSDNEIRLIAGNVFWFQLFSIRVKMIRRKKFRVLPWLTGDWTAKLNRPHTFRCCVFMRRRRSYADGATRRTGQAAARLEWRKSKEDCEREFFKGVNRWCLISRTRVWKYLWKSGGVNVLFPGTGNTAFDSMAKNKAVGGRNSECNAKTWEKKCNKVIDNSLVVISKSSRRHWRTYTAVGSLVYKKSTRGLSPWI